MSTQERELEVAQPSSSVSVSYFSAFNQYVSNALSTLYERGSLNAFTSWGQQTIKEVGAYALEGGQAAGRTITNFYNKPESRNNVSSLFRMSLENVLPVALIWGVSQFIEMNLNPCHGELAESCSPNMNLAMSLSFMMLKSIPFALSIPYQAEFFVRNTIVVAKLPAKINEDTNKLNTRSENIHQASLICADCNNFKAIKNEAWELANYYLQLSAIGLIDFVPYVGSYSSKVLSVLLHGQFLLGLRLSSDGLCGKHREQYFREYFSLSLAIGLSHDLVARTQLSVMEGLLGLFISRVSLQSINWPLRMLDSLAFLLVLHQMRLPKPVSTSYKTHLDPLYALRLSVNEFLELFLPGIEKRVNALLASKGEAFTLTECIREVETRYAQMSQTVVARALLPRTLRDKQAFCTDPILKDYLDLIRDLIRLLYQIQPYTDLTLVTVLNDVSHFSLGQAVMHTALVSANKERKLTPKIVAYFSGFPEKLVNILTNLLTDENFILDLKELTKTLEAFGSTVDDVVIKGTKEALALYTEGNKTLNPGWHRATVFKNLFDVYKTSDSVKYLICLVISLNKDSSSMTQMVTVKIEEALGQKNYFKKNGQSLFQRFSDKLIEFLELEATSQSGNIELSQRSHLESSIRQLATVINKKLKKVSSDSEQQVALETVKELIDDWKEEEVQEIKKRLQSRQSLPQAAFSKLCSKRFGTRASEVEVSVNREPTSWLTKLHQFNEKVRQGIANYLRSKRGGQSGKKRAMAYQRMFKTQTRDPEGNLTVAEVLFNSIISLALLGEQHGQNMRAFVVESLAEGIGGQLEQKALLEKMLHTYLFNDEANKVLLFNAEFSANCYELRQYANAKPSTGLREITAAISQTLDKYTSALEARVVENSGDNSDETTDSEKDLQSSKKGFRQPYFS